MKPLQAIKLVLLAVIIPTLWGCSSDKLSRGKAEKLIKEKLNLPFDDISDFQVYAYQAAWGGQTKISAYFGQLSDEGYITYRTEYFNSPGGDDEYRYHAELTEKGKQYAAGDSIIYLRKNRYPFFSRYIKIKTSRIEFGEITGIVENKESNTAMVNYTLIRKDITPFGKITFKLQEGSFDSSATLTKYDDGWRITK